VVQCNKNDSILSPACFDRYEPIDFDETHDIRREAQTEEAPKDALQNAPYISRQRLQRQLTKNKLKYFVCQHNLPITTHSIKPV